LERLQTDLYARALTDSTIQIVITDLMDADAIQSTTDRIAEEGNIDVALIAHGSLGDQRNVKVILRKINMNWR